MADRTQLKAADRNDIAADDPFAELTRIMGFDPRQPVKPQAPAVEKASADHLAIGGDFDIDLEKELMGEFGSDADDRTAFAEVHEPAFETAAAEAMDDVLAASLEQDFLFDDAADEAGHFFAAAGDIPAPAVEAAFDDNFDNALASSLEDVSPLKDDLPIDDDRPMDDEFAASVEQGFLLDDDTTDETMHGTAGAGITAPDVEAAFDDDFHSAVSASLEEELTLDHLPAQFHHTDPANAEYQAAPAQADADHGISDVDFAGHFDDAMTDVDVDFEDRTSEPAVIEEPQAYEMAVEAVQTKDEASDVAVQEAFDSDFDLTFNDEIAEEVEEPVEQIAAVTAEPTSPAVVTIEQSEAAPLTVEPAMPAAAADERSLEDELNALLGAMTARTVPVAMEPAMVQPVETAEQAAGDPTDPVGSLDWNLDEYEAAEPDAGDPLQPEVVQAADADLDDLLLDGLEDRKSDAEDDAAPATAAVTDINFDDEAFDAAFAKSIDLGHHAAAGAVAQAASGGDKVNWLTARTAPPQPARSWSRVTPVAQSQSSFAAKPTTSAPPASASPLYRDEPVEDATRHIADIDFDDDAFDAAFAKGINVGRDAATGAAVQAIYANAEPAPAPHEQPQHHDEMPDVETVDVPERVVALADDLDIPELNFDDDQPAAPAYDDLDAEFASLLTEMNATEPAAAPARNAAYDDDSYNAGFKSGYDRDSGEARGTHTARPAEPVNAVTGSYADLAGGLDELPGSQPLSQANDLAVDGLDYDPELDEAMSVSGLAERDAARPRRSGLLIATVVGAVAIAGGLGAFALSLGGKGGTDAPVLVKADNAPIKVKPENPGGTVVPNQDNKVYDAVIKGTKPAEPVQQKLVTNTEEPVDVIAKEPQSRVVDLSPDDTGAAAATNAAGNAANDNTAPGNADATGNSDVAATPKSEDRIAQVLQDADKATTPEVVAVAPRKVRTMLVKADGSLVPREDPAPAAPQVAAAEPVDPAPQRVPPTAQADAEQTATVPPVAEKARADQANADQASADQATTDQASADQASADQANAGETEIASTAKPVVAAKPAEAAKAEANTQSADTPTTVPVAPQRPSDQPVDVVGEVKPDQVASIDPGTASTGGGSWSMQIASQPTVESAQSTYQDLQRRYGSVLAGHTANIVKAEIAGKGTFYRVRVPAKSRNDAINLCTSYKAAGGNCFVSR